MPHPIQLHQILERGEMATQCTVDVEPRSVPQRETAANKRNNVSSIIFNCEILKFMFKKLSHKEINLECVTLKTTHTN